MMREQRLLWKNPSTHRLVMFAFSSMRSSSIIKNLISTIVLYHEVSGRDTETLRTDP